MNQHTSNDGTVGKALDLLSLVADFGRPVRFTEVQGVSPLPKATLYRLMQTLTNQRMLTYDHDAQTYALGLRLVRLAHEAWRQSALAPVARPFIDALAEEVGETVHLAQMDAGQVIYVDKRNAASPVEMFSQAGKIGPGFCTGVGKAIMAFLDPVAQADAVRRQAFTRHTPTTLTSAEALEAELAEIASTGIAFDREEHEPGIICIAAPILNDRGRAIGALSVTSTTQRHALSELDRFRPAIQNTAGQIAAAATSWQFPQ